MAALGLCYWAWALSHCGVGATVQLQCAGLVALRQVGSSWTRDRTYVLSIGRQILKHRSPSSNLYVLCFWNLKWSRVTDSRSFYFFLIEFAICCSKPCSGSSAWREDSRFVCSTRRQNNTHCSTDARSGEAVRVQSCPWCHCHEREVCPWATVARILLLFPSCAYLLVPL